MNLRTRPSTEKDIATVCGFVSDPVELFYFFPKADFPLTVPQLQDAIEKRSDATIIEDNKIPVGFANFYRWEQKGCCSIGNVIISPGARGRGVCRYLIETMCSIAREKYQASEVTVSCFNQNTRGILVYTKLGFTPFFIEERTDKMGNHVALIHMRRFL